MNKDMEKGFSPEHIEGLKTNFNKEVARVQSLRLAINTERNEAQRAMLEGELSEAESAVTELKKQLRISEE